MLPVKCVITAIMNVAKHSISLNSVLGLSLLICRDVKVLWTVALLSNIAKGIFIFLRCVLHLILKIHSAANIPEKTLK